MKSARLGATLRVVCLRSKVWQASASDVFGRSSCSWVVPLGALVDLAACEEPPITESHNTRGLVVVDARRCKFDASTVDRPGRSKWLSACPRCLELTSERTFQRLLRLSPSLSPRLKSLKTYVKNRTLMSSFRNTLAHEMSVASTDLVCPNF